MDKLMDKLFDSIAVIGLGYIGLPTAAMLASCGINIIGIDTNKTVVDTINRGEIHIIEPDLDALVKTAVNNGKLRASTTYESADAFIIAVPTPFKENHKPDLSYVKLAAEMLAPVLCKGNLIILESTSPVGTTKQFVTWLALLRPDLVFPSEEGNTEIDINICYCPERVMPGHVMHELILNDRIIGGMTPECAKKAYKLYKLIVKGECLITNVRTAEMSKLVENSFRDVNIAFANELSLICDKLAINVWELIALANHHPRVNILQPGPGVGGHCIAVDPWFIVDSAPEEAKLIRAAREVNDNKPNFVVEQVKRAAAEFTKPTIACLGLTFKKDIDDIRESPAINIVAKLCAEQLGDLIVVEPNIKKLPEAIASKVKIAELKQAIQTANIIVLLVGHKEFSCIDHSLLKGKQIVDAVGILNNK
jgi:UDP-N-acetyl-D-mannosaminuronic acid dehydrogenase